MFNKKANGINFSYQEEIQVWGKAVYVYGFGEDEIRKDRCGARMRRKYYGNTTQKEGWEVDHIKPVSKGGGDELNNLQPLQWENNRHKRDNYPDWYCKNKL